jgi:nucleoid DNA-binding protein
LKGYEQVPAFFESEEIALAKAQSTTSVSPVKAALSKSALIDLVATQNDIPRNTAKGVLASIENALLGSVHPRGAGEFTWPGVLKVTLRKVPARKAGTLVRNPSTGEMTPGAAKPASVRVKIRALSKLKTAALQ